MAARIMPREVTLLPSTPLTMFLTPEELQQLTGYKLAAHQVRWLKANGVPHFVNALGRPVVSKDLLAGKPVAQFELGEVR